MAVLVDGAVGTGNCNNNKFQMAIALATIATSNHSGTLQNPNLAELVL